MKKGKRQPQGVIGYPFLICLMASALSLLVLDQEMFQPTPRSAGVGSPNCHAVANGEAIFSPTITRRLTQYFAIPGRNYNTTADQLSRT
jgi:hypothetical protein